MKGKGVRVSVLVCLLGVLAVSGCATQGQAGAFWGTLLGAGLGQAMGGDSESTLLGAVLGGNIGYALGNEEDKYIAARQREQDLIYAAREREISRELANTRVVNIRNSNGSITQIRLHRRSGRWIGPRGEQYLALPPEEQLRPVYGF